MRRPLRVSNWGSINATELVTPLPFSLVPPPGGIPPARYRVDAGCADEAGAACTEWAASGECGKNAAFMSTACRASCGQCETRPGSPQGVG